MQVHQVELHVQLRKQISITAGYSGLLNYSGLLSGLLNYSGLLQRVTQLQRPGEKIKDACTIAHYSHFSGSSQTGAARDGASVAHLSAALPTEMRNSGCTAWKSDTSPTEARKPPKAEFLTETRQGCSVVRWSGWWFYVVLSTIMLQLCLSA